MCQYQYNMLGVAMRAGPPRLGPHIAGWPAPPRTFYAGRILWPAPHTRWPAGTRADPLFFLNLFIYLFIL